jgi:iron complex outermembrane recepter protein
MKANTKLRNAVRLALASGVATVLAAPAAMAQDEEGARELDRVQVTGSRIQRTDIEGALPVTTIDREQIELSGEANAADLIRNLSFNSAGSFRPQSGSSAQSFAGVSLRGLGESRTLILIDGRRAPIAPNVGSAQDLNSIPLAAVERIEILSDGASAVYGSDAIGGVINVITRKDFEGFEFTYGRSETAREGGETEEMSAIMGISSERGQLMAGVSVDKREIVWQRDREWSSGGGSIFSNNFADLDGAFIEHPDNGSIVPGDGCTGDSFFTGGSGESSRCFYDFTALAADEAEIDNKSLFMRGRYDINFDWSLFMNAQVNRVESFGRYAPVPSSPWPGGLPRVNSGDPNHPATIGGNNPDAADYQQYAGEDLFFYHRFAALGPRDAFIDSHIYDLDLGMQGRAGNFDVEFGARYTESKYIDLGYNYVVGELAQGFIDSGDYNIYDPFSVDDATANQMIATISRQSIYQSNEIYANAATEFAMLGGGPIGVAFGGEYRDIVYADQYDSLSEGGQVVGSAGSSAGLNRDVSSAFAEMLFPITDEFEVGLAARYDDYSDYGDDFSPKLSFRYQPIQEVTFRGSFGEGFRAPPLDILSQQPSFGAASVVHEPTAAFFGNADTTEAIQITTFSIANPDLESEQSRQFSLGVAFQPTDWFSGSVDYFDIEVTDQISFIGAQQIINCLEGTGQVCPDGLNFLDPDLDPPVVSQGLGMAFRDDDPLGDGRSSIAYGQTGYTNLGSIERQGFDINLRSNLEVGPGRLLTNLQTTYTTHAAVNGGDSFAGEVGFPEIRATLSNAYGLGDYQFAWNINYIDGQEGTAANPDEDTPSWTTHDVQFNYYAPWDGRITLGLRNAGDKDPPIDQGFLRGFNFGLYDGYGRQTYLRYTQSF